MRGGGHCEIVEFVCDRPFVVLITYRRDTILFYGKIADLKACESTKEEIEDAHDEYDEKFYVKRRRVK